MQRNAWRVLSSFCAALLLTACAASSPTEIRSRIAAMPGTGPLVTAHASSAYPATEDLIRNFRNTAFYYEFHFKDGRLVEQPLEKPLERWEGIIRYRLIGDGVRGSDFVKMQMLTEQLSELTGLQFVRTNGRADMIISIATPAGRETISHWLGKSGLSVYKERYDIWRRTPGWLCGATLASDPQRPGVLRQAHIFLAAEHSGTRESCLEEEIAQSLGLSNDSDAAPSIFNDDQRSTRLTEHDKILLQTLYDPRLRAGMHQGQAMPLVTEIVREMLGRVPKKV